MKDETTEVKLIQDRYARRKSNVHSNLELQFVNHAVQERERLYEKIIRMRFSSLDDISLLEIGAGSGSNIDFFKRIGIAPHNLYANELLAERVAQLKNNRPDIRIIEGNALDISNERKYSIVFQSTVFSSILDNDFRIRLAQKMAHLLAPGGIILWYDFIFNNPGNPDVKRVSKKEIKTLFGTEFHYRFYRVTLAPPIGRRVGKLYPVFNLFPFLRTHIIAEVEPALS